MRFPELGPQYSEENDCDIISRISTFYRHSYPINQSFWQEAEIDTRFESGDQKLWADMYGLIGHNRSKQFNFNRIKRVINMISGWQRRNRKSTIVTPVENGDSQTADQFTKIMMWSNQQEGVLETISEAFHGALVTGMSLLQVWVDYRSDPVSGNIRIDNSAYNTFIIDPYFRKKDLSDCNGIFKRSYLTRRECMSLLPNHVDKIMNLPTPKNSRDGKFNYMPESFDIGPKNLYAYDEFYFRDYRNQKMLVDSITGETLEWRSQDEDKLKEFLRFYPQITVIESEVPTVKLAIVIEGTEMYVGPNPVGTDKYPFIPVFGYYNPQMSDYPWRIQGVVRGLRDAQYLYNRRKIIELDILESQVTSGYKYKVNALVDPKDVFLTGQGRGIAIKQEAQMSDIEQIQPPQVPPSMMQLSQMLGEEIQQISGVNEELLGSAMDDKAGILSMLRQGAGLTTLQILFDQLDYSQKLLGSLMIEIIQNNFTPGKVKKIIEQEPTPQFYNKAFGKYDAAVEEGINTTTQRQMQFAQLLQLKEIGVPVPDEILLEAATLEGKKELVDSITKSNQAKQQMQEQQLKVQMEEIEARIRLSDARATADTGLGLERASRVKENEALAIERKAEAHKDDALTLLNFIRAVKELDNIDLSHIQQMLAISNQLGLQNKSDEQEAKASTAAVVNASQQAPQQANAPKTIG